MIWGVDLGTRKVSMVGLTDTGDMVAWHLTTKPHPVRGEELTHLKHQVEDVLAPFDDSVLFVEEALVAGARNLRTSLQISQTVGVVLALSVPTYLVQVGKWKKEVLASGNASKNDVADWLRQEYAEYFAACDGNQDLIDACCIALYGLSVVRRSLGAGIRSDLRGDS